MAIQLKPKQDPLASLALCAPAFLIYHLGILFIDIRNGVDFVSAWVLRLLDYSELLYVLVTLFIAVLFFIAARYFGKKSEVTQKEFLWTLLESFVLSWGEELRCR